MKSKNSLMFEMSYTTLPNIMYRFTSLQPINNPSIVVFNTALAKELELDLDYFQKEEGRLILAGNKIPIGVRPISMSYAGHQFGHFTNLGDGRAMLVGEFTTKNKQRYDMQLKGSGPTSYSRRGDGRATLASMLREYIISEAMHALHIPTSRSLSVVKTTDKVYREKVHEGAVLMRIMKSHIRVGTFQYAAANGSIQDVIDLANYTINRHFSYLNDQVDKYRLLLREVIELQAAVIAKWMGVGFIHGVMNTDNVSISGETFDYGPCAFMDSYQKDTVFSSIDRNGRYKYVNQPYIGEWNMARFAECLIPLLSSNQEEAIEIATKELNRFSKIYKNEYNGIMCRKLGFDFISDDVIALVYELLDLMEEHQLDYTNTFLELSSYPFDKLSMKEVNDFNRWYNEWIIIIEKQGLSFNEVKKIMRQNNPYVIPRNSLVQNAIDRCVEDNDYNMYFELLRALRKPFSYDDTYSIFAAIPKPSTIPFKTYCGT